MKKSGEWGEFFPPKISPYGYNESIAYAPFPLTQEEVLRRGWSWCTFENSLSTEPGLDADTIPDHINEVTDQILNAPIRCLESRRLFRITRAELAFYRTHHLPLPRFHPDIRHEHRAGYRHQYVLYDRSCSDCSKGIKSAFPSSSEARVLCDECYERVVI